MKAPVELLSGRTVLRSKMERLRPDKLTLTRLDYRKLYPDAPLPHITPHMFRHTFCTNMANAGMDIKALQYVMGHSDASITLNVYTHASYDHAAEQMAKLVDFPGSSDRQERKMSG